jgi:hypothetical protein
MSSIFMTMSLQSFLQDESADAAVREQVYMYFGNWSRSLITMFEISIWGGTWGRCGRVIIFSVSRNYAVFFIAYLAFVSFAIIRVISSLFIKDTLASAAKEAEVAMQETNTSPEYISLLWTLFNDLCMNGDKSIRIHELRQQIQNPALHARFSQVGVVPAQVPAVLTLMDDGNGEIDFCEFMSGILRLMNLKQGVDLPTILYENKKLLKRVLAIGDSVDELRNDFNMRSKVGIQQSRNMSEATFV